MWQIIIYFVTSLCHFCSNKQISKIAHRPIICEESSIPRTTMSSSIQRSVHSLFHLSLITNQKRTYHELLKVQKQMTNDNEIITKPLGTARAIERQQQSRRETTAQKSVNYFERRKQTRRRNRSKLCVDVGFASRTGRMAQRVEHTASCDSSAGSRSRTSDQPT